MVQAKPDCTGAKFGRVTVLRKSENRTENNRTLWCLQCDCGNVIERIRQDFDRKNINFSCGCGRKEASRKTGQAREKPSPISQKFGKLTCIRENGRKPDRGTSIKLYELKCDCGAFITKPRHYFDRADGKGQKSCGCSRKDGAVGVKIHNIAGQRFGSLFVLNLTGKRDKYDKPTWLCQCDCGGMREISLSAIRRYIYQDIRLNCGASTHDKWLHYPKMPEPMPLEVGKLITKYLYLTELDYSNVKQSVEDEKRDRLIRACWIVVYKRHYLNEQISELKEKRFIKKHLRYAPIDVYRRQQLEYHGGFMYDANNNKKEIGIHMTNVTYENYPVLETSGINTLSTNNGKPAKHLKFKRT